MKQIAQLLILVTLISCSARTQNGSNYNNDNLKGIQSEKGASNTLTVNENCVLFLWPDSVEIAKMKAENTEDAYNTIVDDMSWYFGQAGMICDTLGVKTYACDKEYIEFTNSKKGMIKLKRKELKGDMVLINLKKDPRIENSVNFNKDSVSEYFDK